MSKWSLFASQLTVIDKCVALCIMFFLGDAESGLERLHQCAEKELQVYLEAETPLKDFNDFRTKLAGLTRLAVNTYKKTL